MIIKENKFKRQKYVLYTSSITNITVQYLTFVIQKYNLLQTRSISTSNKHQFT